ncbi:D-alanyl-D-alanine carboxypeptidase family protein [Mesobacillus jeotgali]|jgi:serine-type D-Ala-D-Ala carboxypeptidase (penicillin-binding protein 5/6)|uniref:D-alanyl-D-alanine carboxypeptidase family protein n=1 Tax=Mesobacillus jeotgali TaxID=129985 RepID=A0ABY9VE90_9BACI|nr:D-alanyl-D-alanine carboxypeptidase family protein [Mesobacillus jeotgali]WNF21262.1 D-alanyl-D-alanine carboxypeptidase family protein [Mesobacillus jeotgali]
MKNVFGLFMLLLIIIYSSVDLVAAEGEEDPILTSEAAVLMDTESGAILFGKNEEAKMYPASLTKIATAIYAIESGDLDELVVVSKEIENIDGTRVYLNPGEQVPLRKLVQGMLINSGNDAALAIAIHLDDSMESYSKNINKFLETHIGVEDTHFVNPHGLFDENHYTTAKDLGMILNYAMNNPDFREIFGTKQLEWDGESWDTTILSHHRMLKGEIPYEAVTGGKTGFVDQSKQTLATTADNGNLKLTAILLKSEYKRKIYEDTIKLFDYGFAGFNSSQIKKGETFAAGDLKFKAGEDLFVTEPIEDGKRVVEKDGILKIENKDGEIIQSIELKPLIGKKPEVKKEASPKPEQSGLLSVNTILGALVLVAAAGVWVINRKQKKNRRFRSR